MQVNIFKYELLRKAFNLQLTSFSIVGKFAEQVLIGHTLESNTLRRGERPAAIDSNGFVKAPGIFLADDSHVPKIAWTFVDFLSTPHVRFGVLILVPYRVT